MDSKKLSTTVGLVDPVGEKSRMKALVVFETMFGNTEQVARAIATGLAESLEVEVCDVEHASADPGRGVAIIVAGGPTHAFSMSRERTRADARRQGAAGGDGGTGLREWLNALPRGRHAALLATFDTKVVRPALPGSAGTAAARVGRRRGYRTVDHPATFVVEGTTGPLPRVSSNAPPRGAAASPSTSPAADRGSGPRSRDVEAVAPALRRRPQRGWDHKDNGARVPRTRRAKMTTAQHDTHLDVLVEQDIVTHRLARGALAVLRIGFGLTFLWAFFDKLLALGYATGKDPETGAVDYFGPDAWINGGSPTFGFLSFGVPEDNPFHDTFTSIAGDAWADWLFMAGLLGIGLALTLGIGIRLAAISGAALYLLMWLASLPLENNPVVDDHLLGAITVVVLAVTLAGDTWGLGGAWARTHLVRRLPVLR